MGALDFINIELAIKLRPNKIVCKNPLGMTPINDAGK